MDCIHGGGGLSEHGQRSQILLVVARADRQLTEAHLLDRAAKRAFVQPAPEAHVNSVGQNLRHVRTTPYRSAFDPPSITHVSACRCAASSLGA